MYNSLFLVWFKKSVLIFFFSNVYVKYQIDCPRVSIIYMYKMCYLKCMNECSGMFCVSVFLVVMTCNLLLLVYQHVNIT